MTYEIFNYIANDVHCELAIQEFGSLLNAEDWVQKHSELYIKISIRPEGLPSISLSNYKGKHFMFISEFHALYCKTLKEIDDPFTG